MANRNINILVRLNKYITKIQRYCEGAESDSFLADERLQELCAFSLLQMGELVNDIDDDFILSHPDVPWRSVRGLRNRIVHDYEGVDTGIIWDIINNHIGVFQSQILILIKMADSDQ
ncbi:antitoxin [Synergistales bacterium]|nr:antitoxin [Synergistales bacterium]